MRGLLEPEVLELLDRVSGTQEAKQHALDTVVSTRLGVDVTDLPIGRRDAALTELRIGSFGSHVQLLAQCTTCDEQLEADIDLVTLPLSIAVPHEVPVTVDGSERLAKMPTVADLRAAAGSSDPRKALIDTSLVGCPEDQVGAVEAALEDADPMIDVSLEMQCPSCGTANTTRFDIEGQLWTEVESYGRRLTLEVHWLASRYGWTESDVLALSPTRRRAYLELDPS